MAKIQDAADSIRRAARQYQDFIAAADLLDKFGSIENAITEANVALGKAQKERDAGIAKVNKVMADLETATANHATMLENTGTEAARLIEEAKSAAFDLSVQAQAAADGIVSNAKTQAIAEKNALADDVLALKEAKGKLNDDIQALKDRITGMEAESDGAEKRLIKIKADIAKLATA